MFLVKRKLAKINLRLNTPIISMGASALLLSKIASLLNTKNITPENFRGGAVGAAIGSIKRQ